MRMKRGFYTITNSDLYLEFIPKYYGDGYIKAKIRLFYKYGKYKDVMIEQKNYKIYDKDITHWKKYVDIS